MHLWEAVLAGNMTPGRLWLKMDPEVRKVAAAALYAFDWDDEPVRQDAELAIAEALHFRPVAVRKLTVEQRVAYLARSVRPDDSLLTSLLQALHIEHRRAVMIEFLDALKVDHEEGLIDPEDDLGSFEPAILEGAVETIFERHPDAAALYLLTLFLMDDETWGGLGEVMQKRLSQQPGE